MSTEQPYEAPLHQMASGQTLYTAVEVGTFDMSKLPIDWSKVDTQAMEKAADTLNDNLESQIAQLEEMIVTPQSNEVHSTTKHNEGVEESKKDDRHSSSVTD
jgi:hypothetical protein